MNNIEERRLNRKATKVMVIVVLLIVLLSVLMSSCDYDRERQQRVDALLEKIDNNVQTSTVINEPEIEATIEVSHPDKLHNHIVMDKTITSYIDGNAYQRVLTWNYQDSIYQLYYLPLATSRGLTYQDTIHIVYPKWLQEMRDRK